MKKQILLSTLAMMITLMFQLDTFAQQNVGIGTATPDASAMLDITATDKGILIPRLTTTQRTGVAAPATGLLVYDTDTQSFWYFNGTVWVNLSGTGSTGWLLSGNAGTNPSINFMGTTDNQPITFRVNNIRSGYLGNNGNIFWGNGSGNNNTTGYSNIAIGSGALYNNTDRNFLVAIGDSALYNNGVGATTTVHSTSNTAIGNKALYNNTTGYANTATGYWALFHNETGIANSAYGYGALYDNTIGNFNIAYGNTALYKNETGSNNTAVGYGALYSSITGTYNSAYGFEPLFHNTTGSSNTAIGYQAQFSNTTGDLNTANGNLTLYNNIEGNYNTANGGSALYENTTGNLNAAYGYVALFSNTSGEHNTASGSYALYNNTTGSGNTAIGHYADVATGNLTNATAIGSRSEVSASNSLVLGSINGVNGATVGTSVGIGTSSPDAELEVKSTLPYQLAQFDGGDQMYVEIHENGKVLGYWGSFSGKSNDIDLGTAVGSTAKLHLTTGTIPRLTIDKDGNVGIGTVNPTYRLSVNGNIRSKEVVVESGWADYVFDANYELPSLDELEKFIRQNNHLPNVPSSSEIRKNGLHLGDTQKKMMEKIEELTLYVIEQHKMIMQLKEQVKNLSKK